MGIPFLWDTLHDEHMAGMNSIYFICYRILWSKLYRYCSRHHKYISSLSENTFIKCVTISMHIILSVIITRVGDKISKDINSYSLLRTLE